MTVLQRYNKLRVSFVEFTNGGIVYENVVWCSEEVKSGMVVIASPVRCYDSTTKRYGKLRVSFVGFT